jgi:hypothetical protein
VDDRRLASIASELGMTVEELLEARAEITPTLDETIVGGLVRFEDALFELSQ